MIVPKEYWGAATWKCMYSIAANFDKNTNQLESIESFYKQLAELLPCKDCSNHFKTFISEHDIKLFADPIDWVILLNNNINKKMHKSPVTREIILNSINNSTIIKIETIPDNSRVPPSIKIRSPANVNAIRVAATTSRQPCNCGK